MTDSDIIYKVKNIIGVDTKIWITKHKNNKDWEDAYGYKITGNIAIQWMMTLYSLMGDRRKDKIKEVIIKWKNRNLDNLNLRGIGDIDTQLDNIFEQVLKSKQSSLIQ